ncbi:MAG: HD domain-containing protein [Eggerthellaceae bacterium]|nr:HD domain-containing protein [Eggerthellaceae bacterium]
MSNYELANERFAAMPALAEVVAHPLFRENMTRIYDYEQNRIYCKHGMSHLLDVARIAYIAALEESMPLKKEVIYVAALLHDIGRAKQYESGVEHDVAGARIAQDILQENIYFSDAEKDQIVQAIANHRQSIEGMTLLQSVIFRADKSSRKCYMCKAQDTCKWSRDKMNLDIRI